LHPGLIAVSSFPQADWLQLFPSRSRSRPQCWREVRNSSTGYFHTLREICQRPSTWIRSVEFIQQSAPALSQLIEGISSLTFSGSASSDYDAHDSPEN
jgi:hypothetical protein